MRVEGKNAVFELLRSDEKIDKILIDKSSQNELGQIINLAQKKKVRISFLPREAVLRESTSKNCQGVVAISADFKYVDIDDILEFAKEKNEPPFILLCDGIEDPHNLGSLIRTCECSGVHGLVIAKNRSCQVNDTVIKVSTGACYNLNIARVTNLNDCIRKLQKEGVWVYSLEADGKTMYNEDLTSGVALVVGSEGFGVSQLTKKLSDGILSLPMYGKINSLNASVAGAVAIYEVVRQRQK